MRDAVTQERYVPVDEQVCRLIDQVAVECGIDFINAVDYMLMKGMSYWTFEEGNPMLRKALVRCANKHLTDQQFAAWMPEWA